MPQTARFCPKKSVLTELEANQPKPISPQATRRKLADKADLGVLGFLGKILKSITLALRYAENGKAASGAGRKRMGRIPVILAPLTHYLTRGLHLNEMLS
jgi:hypothetical protein